MMHACITEVLLPVSGSDFQAPLSGSPRRTMGASSRRFYSEVVQAWVGQNVLDCNVFKTIFFAPRLAAPMSTSLPLL